MSQTRRTMVHFCKFPQLSQGGGDLANLRDLHCTALRVPRQRLTGSECLS